MAMVVKLERSEEKSPEFEKILITPAMASNWLEESKFDNRRLDDYNVDKIARDIKTNKWIFDGNPIRFDREGNIIDGQHRLWAIFKSGKQVLSAVVRDLDHAAVDVIDSGKSRTICDIFHFNGHVNNTSLASCARLYIGYRTNGKDMRKWAKENSHRRLSPSELLKEVKNSPGMIEAVSACISVNKASRLIGKGLLSFSAFVLSKIDKIAADEFFYLLDSGANLVEGNAILALRNYFVMNAAKGIARNGNISTAIRFAVIVKAWNAWRKGKAIQRLSYNYENEAFPVAE